MPCMKISTQSGTKFHKWSAEFCTALYISGNFNRTPSLLMFKLDGYCLGSLLDWAGMKSLFLQNPVIHIWFFEFIKGYINGREFDGIPQLPADWRNKKKNKKQNKNSCNQFIWMISRVFLSPDPASKCLFGCNTSH